MFRAMKFFLALFGLCLVPHMLRTQETNEEAVKDGWSDNMSSLNKIEDQNKAIERSGKQLKKRNCWCWIGNGTEGNTVHMDLGLHPSYYDQNEEGNLRCIEQCRHECHPYFTYKESVIAFCQKSQLEVKYGAYRSGRHSTCYSYRGDLHYGKLRGRHARPWFDSFHYCKKKMIGCSATYGPGYKFDENTKLCKKELKKDKNCIVGVNKHETTYPICCDNEKIFSCVKPVYYFKALQRR